MSKDCNSYQHFSVMHDEVMQALKINPQGVYVDCTMGGAGHSCSILRSLTAGGSLLAIDRDQAAIDYGSSRLREIKTEAKYFVEHSEFSQLPMLIQRHQLGLIDGLLADLGVSSVQLDHDDRGFSFRHDGPLDMRMDKSTGLTAAEVINTYTEPELARIFTVYGEERFAKGIARRICKRREIKQFSRTLDLSSLIERSMPSRSRREKHPAKRCFQALRIEVNSELKELEELLTVLPSLMRSGGKACFLTFHSLEDRIVKQAFRTWEHPCTCPRNLPCTCRAQALGKSMIRKGITAGDEELAQNRRSHSARLRCFEFK